VKPGFNVLIEKGAGMSSHFSDAEYESAGAKIVETEEVWKNSDIVMKVGYQMICVQIVFVDFATLPSLCSKVVFTHCTYCFVI